MSLRLERSGEEMLPSGQPLGLYLPGEEVIVVVPPVVATTTSQLSWWQKILSWF